MKSLVKSLGTGIIFASTATGVSHIVHATRAGWEFGASSILIVLIACLLRYSGLSIPVRYSSYSKKSLLEGYKEVHPLCLAFFTFFCISMMCIIIATVTLVFSGYLGCILHLGQIDIKWIVAFVMLGSIIILRQGHYQGLNRLSQIISIILLLGITITLLWTIGTTPVKTGMWNWRWLKGEQIKDMIPLMGWMPTAMLISPWISLWALNDIKDKKEVPLQRMKQRLTEFQIGYIICTFLAVALTLLSAWVLYGVPMEGDGAVHFATQTLELYGGVFGSLGKKVFSLIYGCALAGTCLGVYDGFMRTSSWLYQYYRGIEYNNLEQESKLNNKIIWIIMIGAYGIIYFFLDSFQSFVIYASTCSFILSPILILMNVKVAQLLPKEAQLGPKELALNKVAIVTLAILSCCYIKTLL